MAKHQVAPESYTQIKVKGNNDLYETKILLGKIKTSKTSKKKKDPKPKTNPVSPRGSIFTQYDNTTIIIQTWYDKYIISNNNQIKHFWDILMEIVLAYNLITTMYFLAYRHPTFGLMIVDIICWCFFIIDIFIIMITELISRRGSPIRNFKRIFKIYAKGWLFVDVISVIPLRAGGYYEAEYLLRMLRLLKLPLIINFTDGVGLGYLLTYFNIGKTDKKGKARYSFLFKIVASVIKLLVSVVFIIYFLGCFWYWFQRKVQNKEFSSGETGDDWDFEYYYGLESYEYKDIALRSSYFMLTTIATIGYGDYLPRNVYEMSFLIIIMLFGVTLFAFISGSVNTAVAFYSDLYSGEDFIGNLNTWLNSIEELQGSIPKALRRKVVAHFEYYFIKDRLKSLAKKHWEAESPNDLISKTQPYVDLLNEEVYFNILDNLFNDILFKFRNYFLDSDFFYSISPHFQPRLFIQNEIICEENENFDEVCFITKGKVSIGKISDGIFNKYISIETGDVIGDFSALTEKNNIYEYVAEILTDCLVVPKSVFKTIIENFFPKTRSYILGNSGKRENELKRLDASMRKVCISVVNNDVKQMFIPLVKKKNEFTDDDVSSQVFENIGQYEKICQSFRKLEMCVDVVHKMHKDPLMSDYVIDVDS
ncbi:hypothetical protein SteCoe_35897 [Stentor coeruleus]|uniref:Cyclic nucleotide-binding domain-containing protein n=1 Tax=Stentor coeruleus TaxID=5963 RepID=A0A1R2ARH9_9CILI|nr:hypothetical protein SteCoe_35897 [Stentor coeruleus]